MKTLLEKKFTKPALGFLLATALFASWSFYSRPSSIQAEGYIGAYTLSVSSPTLGTMIQRYVQEGDHLKENQVLFQLDDDVLNAKKNQMQARLQSAQQDLEQKKSQAEFVMQDYLQARRDYDRDQLSAETLEQSLRKLEETQISIQSIQSSITNFEADLGLTLVELEKTRILSPCEAVVVKSWCLPGSVITPQDPVLTLCDLEHLWVEVEVDEREISKVQLGAYSEISLTAYPKTKLTGKVEFISPAILSKNQKVPVKISIDHPNTSILRPGLTAQAKIFLHKK